MKLMIIISGIANTGKTSTCKHLALQLGLKEKIDTYEITCHGEVTINGKKLYVGISSQGDYGECVANGLKILSDNEPSDGYDALIVATRTKGAPYNTARDYAFEHGYTAFVVNSMPCINTWEKTIFPSGKSANEILASNIISILSNL